MSSVAASLAASTSRPVRLTMRADLVCVRQEYQSRAYWVVKDPLGLQYCRLEEEEFAMLEMLDGHANLEQIKSQFERRFAPTKIGYVELSDLLANLHRLGLVYSIAPGQGQQLFDRHRQWARRSLISKFSNPLSIRFRGIYPERLFDAVYPLVRWMFSPVAVAICLMFSISALLLVTVQFDEFRSRLPSFHQFFTLETTWLLLAVLACTKILHEFGHGLACKHFGGECPEMGLLLLVFTPCLYCNVTDAWMTPSKWRRAIVGAAGMYVELLLASIATFVWWFSAPGLVHHLALNVMFVCSVSTLLFNANPLMRYDGYYILADLVEVPNLASKSSAAVKRFLTRIVLGIEPPDDPFLPRRHQTAFAVYAVASTVYRWVVVFSILWFLYEWLKPYRLEVIAQALACVMLVTFVVTPIVNFIRYFRVPGRSAQVKKPRVRIALAVAAAVLVAAALVPVPHRVFAALELEPRDPQNVYVNVPGALAEVLVQPGQHVETGTVLARLENVDLDLDIADLTTKRDRYRSQLESLRHRRFKDPIAGMQIPEVAKTLAAFDEQLAEKERDRERLTLVADRPGTALPAPEQSEPPTQPGELATWSGSPFEPRNRGCYLEKSTLVCHVGDPERYDALVVIDQSDVQQVRLGQEVEIKLDEFPERVFRGRIEEIARMDLKISPRHLSNKSGGELSTKTDASGVERPMAVSYQVRVPIDAPAGVLRSGFRGRAKIFTPWQPAAAQAWRWFCQTFHFKF